MRCTVDLPVMLDEPFLIRGDEDDVDDDVKREIRGLSISRMVE